MAEKTKSPRKKVKISTKERVEQRLMGGRNQRTPLPWEIDGELFLNCSCDVFCPCVVSLGKHAPTEGYCHAWMAIIIDKGHYDGEPLDGISIGLLADIPGRMGEGQWKVAVYVDDNASHKAFHGICQILSGKAGGTTGLLSMLIGEVIGAEQLPVQIERDGRKRRISVGKLIQGEIEMVSGATDDPIWVKNTRYWMGPDIIVAQGTKSRLRDHGRVWDFSGKSAEICPISWSGP
jgi:hypothetical protein